MEARGVSEDRKRIGRALARLWRSRSKGDTRPLARPGCEYGLIVDERLRDMADDLEAVKSLLRWLLAAVVAGLVGLVVDLILKGV